MNTKATLYTLIAFFISLPAFNQITIKQIDKQVEVEVVKPPAYDSLKDYEYSDEILYHYQYIGQKVFYPPCTNRHPTFYSLNASFIKLDKPIYGYSDTAITFIYKPMLNNVRAHSYKGEDLNSPYDEALVDFYTNCNDVCNRYFTILNVINRDSLIEIYSKMYSVLTDESLKKRKIYYKNEVRPHYSLGDMAFLVKDDETKDTLLYTGTLDGFILVPFFVKQKQMFNDKILIADFKNGESPTFYDLINEKPIKIEKGSKWKCEVVLLENDKIKQTYDNNGGPKPWSIYYVLKNGFQTIGLARSRFAYNNKTVTDVGITSQDCSFIIEDVFIAKEKEKQLKKEELAAFKKKQEQIKEEQAKLAKEKYRQSCISLFGSINGELVAEGKIKIGMTTQMCETAWGKPYDKYKTTTSSKITESWYYGWKKSLHFLNDILVRIDE